MKKYQIIKEDGSISLSELSKYNGESELENLKRLISLLAIKAEYYDIPQKVIVSFPKSNEEIPDNIR